ncbi:MAG: flagellar motor protein [Gammaproteobacteria bacterium]|nr:flagellar motor protein [Gammaproteobacteria bacterium]MDH5652165.1 flagellar motor protein [Gammaproteobacteria bacterium]
MDFLSMLGLAVGVAAILLGQYLEGGQISTLINGPAALIVLGGTLGAVMVQTPIRMFLHAMAMMIWVFFPPRLHNKETIEKIVSWSQRARREGLLGLENIEDDALDAFTEKGLQLLVDGSTPENIRNILDLEINNRERYELSCARVFESMGGYSPTIGIIGAVLGLIQVMGNLTDPSRLGDGIAVAFVATIYGVGAANLVFLPIANKLKTYIHHYVYHRELVLEGIVSIAEGENPRNVETRLLSFVH